MWNDISLWLSFFPFTWWLMMLNIFSHVYSLFVNPFYSNMFVSFAHFLIGFFLLFIFKSSLYSLHTSPSSDVICKYFLPDYSLFFHVLHMHFHRTKVLNFDEVQMIFFCYALCFWYQVYEFYTYFQVLKKFIFFSISFINPHFMFNSMVHFC